MGNTYVKKGDDGGISIVELHKRTRGFFTKNEIDGLWHNARKVSLDDNEFLMISNEDLFLFLSLASININEFVSVKYLYDLHRLITLFGKDLNWQKILNRLESPNVKARVM